MAYALGFCCRTGSAAAVAVAPGGGFAHRWAVNVSAPGTPVQLFHAAGGLPAAEVERFVRVGVDAVGAVAAARLRDFGRRGGRRGRGRGNHRRPPAEQRLAADLAAAVARIGAGAGRPWRKEQKLATVAALVAATHKES
jgi:hypothetical protein